MPTATAILGQHVTLYRSIDRLFLNGYIPLLQSPGGLVCFLGRDGLIASPALLQRRSDAFVRELKAYAEVRSPLDPLRAQGAQGAAHPPALPGRRARGPDGARRRRRGPPAGGRIRAALRVRTVLSRVWTVLSQVSPPGLVPTGQGGREWIARRARGGEGTWQIRDRDSRLRTVRPSRSRRAPPSSVARTRLQGGSRRSIEGRATIAHVGDSRAYLYRRGELRVLTQDHSFVAEQVCAGLILASDVKTHPLRSRLSRALGAELPAKVDVTDLGAERGDVLMLCSDGLHAFVEDQDIARALSNDLEMSARRLVGLANAAGGSDNITVALCRAD